MWEINVLLCMIIQCIYCKVMSDLSHMNVCFIVEICVIIAICMTIS